MYERAAPLVRVAALSVLAIGTSPDDVDAVVLAQRADEPTNAVSTGELLCTGSGFLDKWAA